MSWLNNLLRKQDAKAVATPVHGEPDASTVAEISRSSPTASRADPVTTICDSTDKTLALAMLVEIAGDSSLGEVAARSTLADVRLAAAMRIEGTEALDALAQQSRNKDKRVYRHCHDELMRRDIQRKREAAAEQICAAYTELLAQSSVSLSEFLALEKQLQNIGTTTGSPSEQLAQQHLEQAQKRLQEESHRRRDLQHAEAEALALLEETKATEWPDAPQLTQWQTRHQALNENLAGLPEWLSAEKAAQHLTTNLSHIATQLVLLEEDRKRESACEQFLAALAPTSPIDDSTSALWAALPKPTRPGARDALDLRWRAHWPMPAVAAKVTPADDNRLEQIRPLLEKLGQSLAQGQLLESEALLKAIEAIRGELPFSPDTERRLKQLEPQIIELRRWARWSNEQARNQLVEEAGNLSASGLTVEALATAIAGLREAWKKLNTFGQSSKAQWTRFDTILTQAYQPVAEFRAAEAVRHADAKVAKSAVCDEWEALLKMPSWDAANYVEIESKRRALVKAWRELPSANFRDEKVLKKRFDTIVGAIDARLDEVRTVEIERCLKLIEAAETASTNTNVTAAINQIKSLQDRWNKQRGPLRLARSDEHRLWLRFRTACDAVFAKRDEQRVRLNSERDEQKRLDEQLVADFEAALASAEEKTLKVALLKFQKDWAARKSNHDENKSLTARARAAQDTAKQSLRTLEQEHYRTVAELLSRKDDLLTQIEVAAIAGHGADPLLAEIKQQWNELPRLPGKIEQALTQRFSRASTATADGLAQGHKLRDTLLCELEKRLGLPSPELSPEQQRQRQLERLQDRFAGASQAQRDTSTLILDWHVIAASADDTHKQRMAAIQNKMESHVDESSRN